MPRQSQIAIAKPHIVGYFENARKKVYALHELAKVLEENRDQWQLARHTTRAEFVSFLEKQAGLQERTFRSQAYGRKIVRYSWGEASIYELAQALHPRGYLSHLSALAVHSLADIDLKTLYLNVEQSPKPRSAAPLTQHAIDQAFSRKQRLSSLIYEHSDWKVTILNGKNTDRLDVEEALGPHRESIQVTSLERTLVDAVVRPSYAGGIPGVLHAYVAAKNRVSTERLVRVLRELDHMYPYHQAIGFLMERAGYPTKKLAQLQALGIQYKFHLVHGTESPDYDARWQLFYPQGLKSTLNP